MSWAKFARSEDGSYFAFLTPEVDANMEIRNEIKIYKCDTNDPFEILDQFERRDGNEPVIRLQEDEKMGIDMSFIK